MPASRAADVAHRFKFALTDTALAIAPIFRPTPRGVQGNAGAREDILADRTADERRIQGYGLAIRNWRDFELGYIDLAIKVPEQVGVREQNVYLAILAHAGIKGRLLDRDTAGTDNVATLSEALLKEGTALVPTRKRLYIESTMARLLEDAGMAGGGADYRTLQSILARLADIGYRATGHRGNRRFTFSGERLLSYSLDGDGLLRIALSERLSRVFLGVPAAGGDNAAVVRQFAKVSLEERRRLSGDVACLLHAFLSGRITNYREIISVDWETMIRGVYGLDLEKGHGAGSGEPEGANQEGPAPHSERPVHQARQGWHA